MPDASVEPTEQYFVADSSTERRTASGSTPVPSTTCTTSNRVNACGRSRIWVPETRIS